MYKRSVIIRQVAEYISYAVVKGKAARNNVVFVGKASHSVCLVYVVNILLL